MCVCVFSCLSVCTNVLMCMRAWARACAAVLDESELCLSELCKINTCTSTKIKKDRFSLLPCRVALRFVPAPLDKSDPIFLHQSLRLQPKVPPTWDLLSQPRVLPDRVSLSLRQKRPIVLPPKDCFTAGSPDRGHLRTHYPCVTNKAIILAPVGTAHSRFLSAPPSCCTPVSQSECTVVAVNLDMGLCCAWRACIQCAFTVAKHEISRDGVN